MTLTAETIPIHYDGDGSTVSFPITFVYWEDTDIEVTHRDSSGTETTWVDGTQYTLSGGSGSTGTLTVDTSPTDYTPANNETLTIDSNRPNTQPMEIPLGGPLNTPTLEQALDQITRLIRQVKATIARTLTAPVSDTGTSFAIPNETERASARLGFDSSGSPIAVTADITGVAATAFGTTIVEAVAAAAARTLLGLVIGTDVEARDADILRADTADTLTAGFNATENDAGTKSTGTFTPDPADGNFQKAVNGGAHTLAPPGSTCSIVVQYTNDGSAGAITTSGFTLVDGDTITTTDGHDFLFFITRDNSFSHLHVKALQ